VFWKRDFLQAGNKMIKLENINKRFESENGDLVFALDDINLQIEAGEIFGIIGQSGQGKRILNTFKMYGI